MVCLGVNSRAMFSLLDSYTSTSSCGPELKGKDRSVPRSTATYCSALRFAKNDVVVEPDSGERLADPSHRARRLEAARCLLRFFNCDLDFRPVGESSLAWYWVQTCRFGFDMLSIL